jgi:hypothetical protein
MLFSAVELKSRFNTHFQYQMVATIIQKFDQSAPLQDILSPAPGRPAPKLLKESAPGNVFEDGTPVSLFLFSDLILIAEKGDFMICLLPSFQVLVT